MTMSALAHRLGHTGLKDAAEKGLRAMSRLKGMMKATEENAGQAIQSLEIGAAAFGFGFARGYFAQPGKDLEVIGIPLDLGAGLAGHAMGLLGFGGKYKKDTHNLADGAMSSFLTTLGMKIGIEQREKHPPTATQALPAGAATRGMDVHELVRQANFAQR